MQHLQPKVAWSDYSGWNISMIVSNDISAQGLKYQKRPGLEISKGIKSID